MITEKQDAKSDGTRKDNTMNPSRRTEAFGLTIQVIWMLSFGFTAWVVSYRGTNQPLPAEQTAIPTNQVQPELQADWEEYKKLSEQIRKRIVRELDEGTISAPMKAETLKAGITNRTEAK